MCGIIGIVDSSAKDYIQSLKQRISHRGPDSQGDYCTDKLAFGHLRLAIQDLSPNGHQPMFSADGRYVLIFNGEIYNHLEIREKLKGKYTFKSSGDTETVLYGFIEFGADIFNQLNGIFALAIFDTQERILTIARDPFGIKPLYYYLQNDTLLFGSEIKSFLEYPHLNKTLNPKALVNYLTTLWSAGAATPLQHVHKLLSGHFMTVQIDDLTTAKFHKYYEIPFNGQYSQQTEAELIAALDDKLFKAVKSQLLSDVPVGFFLSGGLDSSAIVAMAKKAQPDAQLRCYTIDTGEGLNTEGFSNDLVYAKMVAQHLDVDLQIVKGQIDILKDFDKMVYHLDEPQADIAPLHVLNICKQARKDGFTVLLGGTAGDDLFSGYRRHQALRYEPYFRLIPKFCSRLLKTIVSWVKVTNPKVRRLKKVIAELDKTPQDRLVGYFNWTGLEDAKNLLAAKFQHTIADYNPLDTFKAALKYIPFEKNELNKMLFLEMKYFLCDHNLNYTDKLSMATGVEVRVPFLDKELVEFSTTIPPHFKMKGVTTKYLLKKVMEKYLPHDVIYRPKAGFGAPVRQWITHELDATIQTAFSKEKVEQQGIFNYDKVQELIELNKKGEIDGSYTILSLLAINSWLDQFTNQPKISY